MKNHEVTFTYWISEIPDPAFSQYQAAANGDIRKAIFDGCEHLLRTLVNMPSKSLSFRIFFVYDPNGDGFDRQKRLNIYLQISAANRRYAECFERLLRGGLLSRFYELKKVDNVPLIRSKLNCSCQIVRREDFIRPLHSCNFNYKAPDRYYTIGQFEPDEKNDYIVLDRVLDKLNEPVVVVLEVSPADISAEYHQHTAYLSQLGSVNRSWDNQTDDIADFDYFGDNDHRFESHHDEIKPLTYRDPLADDLLRCQRRFHEDLRKPHLNFHISVQATTDVNARLITSVVAESAFNEGSYRLIADDKNAEDDGNSPGIYKDLRTLVNLATVDEILGAIRLPVSFASPYCIRKNTDPEFIDPDDMIVLGYDYQGHDENLKPVPRGIHIDVLRKHFSLFGLPGVGKTTSVINILLQLNKKGIPFMVIESAKSEYRVLKKFKKHPNKAIRKLAKELVVYTLGNEEVSPLRFNPFEIPPGVGVDEHIENILACFKAVIPVASGSLPALIGEALENIYEKFPNRDKPPVMSDLVLEVEKVLSSKSYSKDTCSDIQTAIQVRLGELTKRNTGKIFQCRKGINITNLMKIPSILEMDRLSAEQKCVLTLFKLNSIRENLKTSDPCPSGLRYAVVIEEAHNIFGKSNTNASEEIADPKGAVAEYISKMLVELRSLGVAIILSDQHPSSLDCAATKSVGSKMGLRTVYRVDRQILGDSMLLEEFEMLDMARMLPGEAFFFTEGYFKPLRIRTVNIHKELDLTNFPTDTQLCEILKDEKWFKDESFFRRASEIIELKTKTEDFLNTRKSLVGGANDLIAKRGFVVKKKSSRTKAESFQTIITGLKTFKGNLISARAFLVNGAYKKSKYLLIQSEDDNKHLGELKRYLTEVFDNQVVKSTDGFILRITDEIERTRKLKLRSIENERAN